jgi:hypothetical protein
VLLALFLSAGCGGEGGGEPEPPQAPASWVEVTATDSSERVEAVLSASPSALHIGDRIRLSLKVQAPEGFRILDPPEQIPPLLVLERSQDSGAREGLRWNWEATVFQVGPVSLQPVELRFLDPEGQEGAVVLGSLEIEVLSLLEEGEEELADIRGPVDVPRDWTPLLLWVGGPVLALLACLVLSWLLARWWRARRQRRAVAPVRPPELPEVVALRRLDALRAKGPPPPTQAKPYYVELSETLREYLEGRFGVEALERTTEEMVFLLRRIQINQRLADRIVRWLGRSDLVKFARQRPAEGQAREDLEEAYTFVRETAPPAEEAGEARQAV